LAWLYVYGTMPKEQIDHINHVRDDNRIINLREVTHSENHKNRTKQSNNTSGVTGVHWLEEKERWQAYIKGDDKKIHLGTFKNKNDAISARKEAEIKYNYHSNHGVN